MTDRPDNPLPGQAIDLPMPPELAETIGCRGQARYMAFSWSPAGDRHRVDRGRGSRSLSRVAASVFVCFIEQGMPSPWIPSRAHEAVGPGHDLAVFVALAVNDNVAHGSVGEIAGGGLVGHAGRIGQAAGTRNRFPAPVARLSIRW